MFKKYLGKYNDILLGLVLIPFINTINYHLTYSHIRWDWYTITTYSIDTVTGWISWWIMRSVVLWLDKHKPYEAGLGKRIRYQLFYSNTLILGFIIVTTWTINELFGDNPLPISFYTYNLFIFFIWILVLNGIYIGFYFLDQWQISQELVEKERAIMATGFNVQKGQKVIALPFKEIAAIYREDGISVLIDMKKERFVLDRSLSILKEQLPASLFYRVNRKYILNRELIEGYRKESYGKLSLLIKPIIPITEKLVISRLTAPSFKKWLEDPVSKS